MAQQATARHWTTTGDDLLERAGRLIAYHLADKRCPCCNRRMSFDGDAITGLSMDHIISLKNGGGVEGNLLPLCRQCNSSKGTNDLASWMPGWLLRISRIETIRGARTATTYRLRRIETLRKELTAKLIEAGIWS